MPIKEDIKNKADIELMIRTFYASLLTDEIIKPVFVNTDFEKHMPHMIAFWSFVLLDEEGYKTNVFDKHVNLGIKEEHFEIWLSHFEKTINDLFIGEKAELAKLRAQTIAYTFKVKLKEMGKL
ncbi:MAG TPA: group III truncated hemoglobin [Bacteroidia bacterium]|jgi:hemoglobin|nr:group III truncated hemoglobin [Bacteroidia bacterium]